TRVATEKAVVAKNPDVAWAGGCLVWRLGDLVRIGQAGALVGLGHGGDRIQRCQDFLFLLLGPGADQYRDLPGADLLARVTVDQPLRAFVVEKGARPADLAQHVFEG